MKTQEEIDELYHKYWDDFSHKYDDNLHYYSFVEGYTQCQKDNKDKKYTEDDIKEAAYFFVGYKTAKNQDIFDKDIYAFIDYLNKQDNE